MSFRNIALVAAFGAALAACGDTTLEQGIIGAGAGAAAGEVLVNEPVTGAAVGAAANVLYCKQNPGRC